MGTQPSSSMNDHFFFATTGMDPDRVTRLVTKTLRDADGGELYLQHSRSRALSWSDGKLKSNSSELGEGFGLRYVLDDASAFAHSNNLSEKMLGAAAKEVRGLRTHRFSSGGIALPNPQGIARLYTDRNPLEDMTGEAASQTYIKLLEDTDKAIRAADPAVTQVGLSISTEWDVITIIRKDGTRLDDVRPMTMVRINVTAEKNGRRESGNSAYAGRSTLSDYFARATMKDLADEALRQIRVALESVDAPAGEMPVVLGPGPAAVMLHEAVGHGLEGDFNRMGSSAFSGKVGQQVASKGVTVIDQGNIDGQRGSIHFDDEGVQSGRTVLIEDGVLQGYMQDTMNARLMKVPTTGNGRREHYACEPMPRMTTTHMQGGAHTPEEIIASVDRGLYAKRFAGGEVDIVSGKFVFAAVEAYLIENGKSTTPVKGATLIGSGPEAMKYIDMIGNDSTVDEGTWTCGKSGQSVPVGVGQPTLKMRGLTVGGTG